MNTTLLQRAYRDVERIQDRAYDRCTVVHDGRIAVRADEETLEALERLATRKDEALETVSSIRRQSLKNQARVIANDIWERLNLEPKSQAYYLRYRSYTYTADDLLIDESPKPHKN